MKTMLLSFKPKWFEKIVTGEKKFEYRNSFANEEVMAYMYVSTPVKSVVGRIYLGKRIELADLKEKYRMHDDVRRRIEFYMEKHKFVMPIKSVQMTEAIPLERLREFKSDFVCPQMYYYLDKRQELLKYISDNAKDVGIEMVHDFADLPLSEVCRVYSNKEEE